MTSRQCCRRAAWVPCVVLLTVVGCVITTPTPIEITPTVLTAAIEGRAYSAGLINTGGGDTTWSIASGQLPDGLFLGSESGVITGTPTLPGTYSFTVKARSGTQSGEINYSLQVISMLRVQASLANPQVDVAYSAALLPSGGLAPYTYSSVGLPAGLSLDSDTGVISGSPVVPAQSVQLQFTVTDSNAGALRQTATTTVFVMVRPRPVSITTTELPNATLHTAYTQAVAIADGLGPYSFAITSGTLSGSGLRLDTSTGAITGTPAQAGIFEFTVRVTDSDVPPNVASQALSIVVE